MANYELFFPKIVTNEGKSITKTANDIGGFTVVGVAQHANPSWIGFKYCEQNNLKAGDSVPQELMEMVHTFYKEQYWDRVLGDTIINQQTAEDLCDSAINMGVHEAVILSQRVLGLQETGVMTATTLNVLNANNNYA